MSVKKYSLKKDGNLLLSENFRVKEFKSGDGADEILVDEKLVKLLQKMRNKFGKILITSAYRTTAYNKKVGGVSSSQHIYGKAADITLSDSKQLLNAARYAEKIGFTGIGLDNKYSMFLHLDTREKNSFFKYYKSGATYSVSSFFITVGEGSRGEDVKCLQKRLKESGFKGADGKVLSCDGIFGKNTCFALKKFQSANSLTPDGIAGVKTWRAIF